MLIPLINPERLPGGGSSAQGDISLVKFVIASKALCWSALAPISGVAAAARIFSPTTVRFVGTMPVLVWTSANQKADGLRHLILKVTAVLHRQRCAWRRFVSLFDENAADTGRITKRRVASLLDKAPVGLVVCRHLL